MLKKLWWFFFGTPVWIDNCDPESSGWKLISGYEGSIYKTYQQRRWTLELNSIIGKWTLKHEKNDDSFSCKFPLNKKEMQQINKITGWNANEEHSYT